MISVPFQDIPRTLTEHTSLNEEIPRWTLSHPTIAEPRLLARQKGSSHQEKPPGLRFHLERVHAAFRISGDIDENEFFFL